ncbi:Nitrogen regulation protein NR(I) [Thioalkalivibrio nitratireducens DSM 14787]|uniref:DNA-binding transcriptional regulator NtrC n=1 Tax=Thioalkalivibrio nitratireducens (strain DSM 14787 / UNIQEM 213 / ALEN2) TaxID=1255043 RepID=L0E260_THIND|nr:nitrogen regulation protein NR(I) [Thioalkalivibrio nitratireducens]AGA35363.1 Nitrogen regulation protein NR(I) [Thioalkalivibrio nitratireducens DSM 14787]
MKTSIWVIDDDDSIRWVLERALSRAGLDARGFESADLAWSALEQDEAPDVIVADIRMPGLNGLDFLARVRNRPDHPPVIIMTAFSDLESAVAAYQTGAFEYLPKPFDLDEAVGLVRRALQARRESRVSAGDEAGPPAAIIGEAPAMQELFRAIGRLSRSNITVLVNGESGTGKELVARALHQHSPRAHQPLIALNTAAIPKDLLESELFGHERGAFTGASQGRKGRFEQADGGTLFLDEIGDMPFDLQTRLLRVLSDGTFYRVGGHTPIRVDVRIIAATHQDLEDRVAAGLFREDLFHRLNVIRIHVPALRERPEDIPLLIRHFMLEAARDLDVEPKLMRPEVVAELQRMRWPGNVRQLENTCRWLTVMASGREVHLEDLPPELRGQPAQESTDSGTRVAPVRDWTRELAERAREHWRSGSRGVLAVVQPQFERTLILEALAMTDGHRQQAAALLGWGRNTLTRKIQELGIDRPDPR